MRARLDELGRSQPVIVNRSMDVESWRATEQDLRSALESVATLVPALSHSALNEYLDHNELGLAFESIVYELDRVDGVLPQGTIDSLRSAYDRMGQWPLDAPYREACERVHARGVASL